MDYVFFRGYTGKRKQIKYDYIGNSGIRTNLNVKEKHPALQRCIKNNLQIVMQMQMDVT